MVFPPKLTAFTKTLSVEFCFNSIVLTFKAIPDKIKLSGLNSLPILLYPKELITK